MVKRIVSLMLVLVTAVIGLTTTAFAQEVSVCNLYTEKASATEVTPYWLYTNTYSSELSISGTTATCTSKVTGYPGVTTKIVITQTLQKKNSSGEWEKVTSWEKTVDGFTASVTNYAYNLSKGTYRLKSVFKVYSGSDYETITKYSSEKTVK